MNNGIHPPKCQFDRTKTGKSLDTCLLPHFKVDDNQIKGRRKAISQKEGKVKTKAVAIVRSVQQLDCVSRDLDALASQGTKEFRGNPMQKVLNAIQRVRFTVSTLRLASVRDKKGPSLGNKSRT